MGTIRRAQRRRFSSFPFVGPQDQTVNARDRKRGALFAGTTKASPRRLLFTASHNGPSTEHGQLSLEHTRPRCTQICRKFAAKEWSLGVELCTERFYPPPAQRPDRLCHIETRLTFANWVCAVPLYFFAHLRVSCGLREQPFTRSHQSGELQNSSTATLHNQSHMCRLRSRRRSIMRSLSTRMHFILHILRRVDIDSHRQHSSRNVELVHDRRTDFAAAFEQAARALGQVSALCLREAQTAANIFGIGKLQNYHTILIFNTISVYSV